MAIIKQEQLAEGKTKRLFRTSAPTLYWISYKEEGTSDLPRQRGQMDRGVLNNLLSIHFFQLLRQQGVDNHLIERLSSHEMLVQRLEMIPLMVAVYNSVVEPIVERLGLPLGTPLKEPMVEFYHKADEGSDPLIPASQVLVVVTAAELAAMENQALRVNEILSTQLAEQQLELVDCQLEFGFYQGDLLLGDEISLNTCRLQDTVTGGKLQTEFSEADEGDKAQAYRRLYRRITGSDPILN